jgi:hypothetical protein
VDGVGAASVGRDIYLTFEEASPGDSYRSQYTPKTIAEEDALAASSRRAEPEIGQ